ncbi:MAG: matrixin family metalloprotease [Planctomycetes bacterium]|nr:matrixin family metalloprotease [Planctomycetota bacterium]
MRFHNTVRHPAIFATVLAGLAGFAYFASTSNSAASTTEPPSTSANAGECATEAPVPCAADFAPGTDPRYAEAFMRALNERYGGNTVDFVVGSRWAGANGDPIELTWSFVPDGTSLSGNSQLFSRMDADYANAGGRAAWIAFFTDAFARWDELTGIKFTRVVVANDADDGAAWGLPGQPGMRGDIRIREINIDGPLNTLAFAQLPNQADEGEITFDSSENWRTTPWLLPAGTGFERTTTHEIGHAIGLDHVFPTTSLIDDKLMMPFAPGNGYSNYGPQHDDVRGAQELYGDFAEPNDTLTTAFPFALPTQTLPAQPFLGRASFQPRGFFSVGTDVSGMGTLSIDSPNDVDVFALTITQKTFAQISLVEVGLQYQSGATSGSTPFINSELIYDLQLELLDRTGAVLVAASPVFDSITTSLRIVGEPYYVRVSRVPGSTSQTEPQQYELRFNLNTTSSCGGSVVCDDGNPTNGVETCLPDGSCGVTYVADCNGNGFEDSFDISSHTSIDCNANGIPDECECDCNGNGRDDACDIALGSSDDLDGNGQPDECQADCNGNGFPDAFDIASAIEVDANDNGVPDSCEATLLVPSVYPSIRAALLNADDGDTILVSPGTWTGQDNTNLVVHDKTVQIIAEQGPTVTTIDPNYTGRAFILTATPKSGINHTRIEGFRITRAQTPVGDSFGPHGGAIFVQDAAAVIDRCYFDDCHAFDGGGAIAISGETEYCWGPFPKASVQNSMFWANVATQGGAIYTLNGASPVLVNCSIALNSAGSNGTGSGVKSGDTNIGPALISCIVWQNFPVGSQLARVSGPASLTTQNCDLATQLQAQYGSGPGNLFVDPLFVNLTIGDLHIKPASPCKNTGSFTFVRGDFDIDHQVRVYGPRVDIGADELKYKIQQQGL